MYEEDDEEREEMLKLLRGDVSDVAASQLEDPAKPKGVTVTISIDGKSQPAIKESGEEESKEVEEAGEKGGTDDHIAHILGMCESGCGMCKGGEA